jgi:Uma2 family endonuclease
LPLLVVEILSPSTARHDRVKKRARYQRSGVEAWIVDIEARLVERWLPSESRPEVLTERVTWSLPGAGEVLEFELDALFDDAG